MKKDIILPKVCICIPAYNAEATISKTLDSLLNQTYKNIIIKVIDNNSQDKTLNIVKEYCKKNKQIKCFSYIKTVPSNENFDRCIEHAEGEYTCIFHSDDLYTSKIIEEEVKFLEKNKEVGAVFTYANVVNENDEKIFELIPNKEITKKEIYNFKELFPLFLKFGNCFVTPSAMVRTQIYKNEIIKHKRKDNFGNAYDVDVWFRILEKHKIGFIYKKLMNYRLSVYSTSFRSLLLYKNSIAKGMFNVLKDYFEKHQDLNIYKSDYINLKVRNQMADVFKAIVCGDYNYAKILFCKMDFAYANLNMKIKKNILKILILCPLPECIRKIIVYVKFRNVLKGQFNKIKLEKM